jgi:phage terminase large subunit-like protein
MDSDISYQQPIKWLMDLSWEQAKVYYALVEGQQDKDPEWYALAAADLGKKDLYYLLRYILKKKHIEHPWLFARCREVQKEPNGYIDLWAREHFKSTIITVGMTILDVLNNPNITVGIFSFNNITAKRFLLEIMQEFESNALLKSLYPDIFYHRPKAESRLWSVDKGILVKRVVNRKEPTIAAHGLIDGMPTGMHYGLRVFDDVVTAEAVTTPEMMAKVLYQFELSDNLGESGGEERVIGTRYFIGDAYGELLKRGAYKERIYPCTLDGSEDFSKAVLKTADELEKKRTKQGPYTFACQMLQNPTADKAQGFSRDWLQWWRPENKWRNMNLCILVDSASSERKGSDFTTMWVVGRSSDRKWRVVTVVRDRMNLTERARVLFRLHKAFRPMFVGYEQYSSAADIEHMNAVMEGEMYNFLITPLRGGDFAKQSKNERIRRLVAVFERGDLFLPESVLYTNVEGKKVNLIEDFLRDEYDSFPASRYKDMLDALSRICDQVVLDSVPVPQGYGDKAFDPIKIAKRNQRRGERVH